MKKLTVTAVVLLTLVCFSSTVSAQEATVLAGAELTRVVPPGFYFKGLSAPTQMRNSAALRMGERHVVVGLVDTSGYGSDIRERYEGFFITDSPIRLNDSELAVGAYGFGFSKDGKLNILDLAGTEILSVKTTKDGEMKRPRPLMMSKGKDGIRFYSGRDFAMIAFK
jgi:hypothetical protein